MSFLKKYIFCYEFLILAFFFILYNYTAPYTVQSGDTGELVTNSYFLRVSHPPGYPLWTLLYHIPIKYFGFVSPFHAASVFTIMISMVWMGLLIYRFRNKASLSVMTVLGTSLIFWRYSILPDVFNFHLFFLAILFVVFIDKSLLDKPWIIFLISLSVANHHTILFFFPVYAFAVMTTENSKKKIYYSLLFGALSMSIYLLLMCFNPEDYGSWGNLTNIKTVINHFLRKEYGTFRLLAKDDGTERLWIHLLVKTLLTDGWSIVIGLIYIFFAGWKKIKNDLRSYLILGLCLVSYLITFYFGGVMSMNGLGESLFERFLLQPILILFFVLLFAVNKSGIELPRWIILSFLVNAGLNVTNNLNANNYHKNTYVEDFARNAFAILPPDSIYYSYGDTQGSAAYYLNDIFKIRPDIIHLQPSLTFPWSINKARLKYPQAFDKESNSILENIKLDERDLYINFPVQMLPEHIKVTFYGILFKISKDKDQYPKTAYECNLSYNYVMRNRPALEDLSKFEVGIIYALEYGRCHYTYALELLKLGNTPEAIKQLEKSIELSPYSAKFLERLCHLYKVTKDSKSLACEERLEKIVAAANRQYYLYEYEK